MTLQERLQNAVEAVTCPANQTKLKEFWNNWRGLGDGSKDGEPCIALVEYARSVDLQLKDAQGKETVLSKTLSKLQTSFEQSQNLRYEKIRKLLSLETNGAIEPWQRNIATQLVAITATVRAAALWKSVQNGDRSEPIKEMKKAIEAWNKAFPLTTKAMEKPKAGEDPFDSGTQAILLLTAALQDDAKIPHTTWLSLERLLRHLFKEVQPESVDNPASPTFINQAFLPTTRKIKGDQTGEIETKGVLVLTNFQSWHDETLDGAFFCPMALGVTPVDDDLWNSIRLAWRISRQSLDSRLDTKYRSKRAVRISPDITFGATSLTGPSGGGLTACAVLATAMGKTIDKRRTASIALRLSEAGKNKGDDEELSPADVEFYRVGGIPEKLDEAFGSAEINGFALHSNDYEDWKKTHPNSNILLHSAQSLPDLFKFLQGDAWYEDILRYHAELQASYWKEISGSPPDPVTKQNEALDYDEHRPDRFVHPRFKIRVKKNRAVDAAALQHEVFEEVDVEETKDDAYYAIWNKTRTPGAQHNGKNILVYDESGSGKTVSSLYWNHLLTNDDTAKKFQGREENRHRLVVRWEGTWPTATSVASLGSLREALQSDRNLTELLPNPADRRGLVNYALKNKRVVILLDGFDQCSRTVRQHIEEYFSRRIQAGSDAGCCTWIVFTRKYLYFEMENSLFTDSRWMAVCMKGFDEGQQDDYFKDLNDQGIIWRKCLTDSDDLNELLQIPMVLRMIRRLIEDARQTSTGDGHGQTTSGAQFVLPKFESMADLFAKVVRMILDRAIHGDKLSPELKARQHELKLKYDSALELLGRVIGVLAFQMQLREQWNGRFEERSATEVARLVQQLKFDAASRFHWQIDAELARTDLTHSQRRMRERQLELELDRWEWAIEVLQTIETQHRAVNEVFQSGRIEFRSRKMMEGYTALYLSRHATDRDRLGNGKADDHQDLAVWTRIGDAEWENTWRMVVQMPERVKYPQVWKQSTGLLFRPVRNPLESKQRRPTELMSLLEDTIRSYGEGSDYQVWMRQLIDQLALEFEQILNDGSNATQQSLAKRLLFDNKTPNGSQFIRIGPGSGLDGDDWTGEHYAISRYLVRNREFQLFDPAQLVAHNFCKNPDWPATDVSWWDAYWFARFVGQVEVGDEQFIATLPTGDQSEHASRAGSKGDYCKGEDGNEVTGMSLSEYAIYSQKSWGSQGNPDDVGSKKPNYWGIYDFSGNVWVWCIDARGRERLRRAGSWSSTAGDLQSRRRHAYHPSFRSSYLGFRLSLSRLDKNEQAE